MSECNFCNKYNMSHADFMRAVKDGKISTTVMRHDELYSKFKSAMSNSTGVEDAVMKVSISEGVDERTIYRAIAEFR